MSHGDLVAADLLRGPQLSDELLHDLPKVDLHVHLDGSLRLSTFIELCEEHGYPLPGSSTEATRELLSPQSGAQRLEDYIALFEHTIAVLQDAVSLRRVAREIVEDCAAENVWHVELRFSPSLHQAKGLSWEEATDAVLEGIAEGRAATGISAGLLIAGVRHRGPDETLALAHHTVRYKGRGVIGFDLAGVEADKPAKRFTAAFQVILDNNINCTVHAGEEWGPESIHQAVHYLNAHRISHATRLVDDEELMAYLADHRIPIELGLSSSVRTGTIPSLDRHPLRRFLRHGMRVTLTTNNRLLLCSSLSTELRLAVDTFDLTLLETENLLLAGFKSAFLPQTVRRTMIRSAVDSFREVRLRHGLEVAE